MYLRSLICFAFFIGVSFSAEASAQPHGPTSVKTSKVEAKVSVDEIPLWQFPELKWTEDEKEVQETIAFIDIENSRESFYMDATGIQSVAKHFFKTTDKQRNSKEIGVSTKFSNYYRNYAEKYGWTDGYERKLSVGNMLIKGAQADGPDGSVVCFLKLKGDILYSFIFRYHSESVSCDSKRNPSWIEFSVFVGKPIAVSDINKLRKKH